MHFWECLLYLAINRKKFYQNFSSFDNSITVHLLGCLVLWTLTEKQQTAGEVFTIMSKQLHLKLRRRFGQKMLFKNVYQKYSAAYGWDFPMS